MNGSVRGGGGPIVGKGVAVAEPVGDPEREGGECRPRGPESADHPVESPRGWVSDMVGSVPTSQEGLGRYYPTRTSWSRGYVVPNPAGCGHHHGLSTSRPIVDQGPDCRRAPRIDARTGSCGLVEGKDSARAPGPPFSYPDRAPPPAGYGSHGSVRRACDDGQVGAVAEGLSARYPGLPDRGDGSPGRPRSPARAPTNRGSPGPPRLDPDSSGRWIPNGGVLIPPGETGPSPVGPSRLIRNALPRSRPVEPGGHGCDAWAAFPGGLE